MGYTIAAMREGRLLGATSVGNAAAYQNNPAASVVMTPDAQWDWLGMTKAVTAVAALKVADTKGISLSAPILPYIASRLSGSGIGTSGSNNLWNITILQAMTQTSNLGSGGCDGGPGTWESAITPSLLNGPLGQYSDSGYNACLLRLFVEQASGSDFPTYLDSALFRPMGIHNLDCLKDSEKAQVLAYDQPPNYYSSATFPYTEPNVCARTAASKGPPSKC